MNRVLNALVLVALSAAPSVLMAEDRVSIAPIAQWGADDDTVEDTGGGTSIFTNGPIIILGDGPGRRDEREERRDGYLPQSCLQTYEVSGRSVRLFEADCLRASHIENRELPRACQVSVRTSEGRVNGYDPSCLRDEGYRLAGR